MKNLHKQDGSLVLGFIVGLIAGLVIAVIIAMVITKTTSPFTQKQARQGKIAEAASVEPIDPNKAMYASASATQDAAKASAKSSAKTVAVRASVTKAREPIKTVTPPEPARQQTPFNDPIAEKIRQKSTPTPGAHKFDDNGDARWTYMVQTNAYRDQVEAQNERARLALSGFEAKISESRINGTLLYRVRMGPFPNAEAMNNMISRLANNGINAVPVRIPKK